MKRGSTKYSKMKRVELIGPSGVGKTTLYNELKAVPENERSYLTLKEAYKYGAIYKNVSVKYWQLWLYQKLLEAKVLDHKAQGLGKYILKSSQNNSEGGEIVNNSFTISYFILLNDLKEKENGYVSLKQIKNFTRKIDEYLVLERSLPKEALIDEGMNHHHPAILPYASKFSVEEIKKDVALIPAGIISCEQTAEGVYKQALARKQKGIYTFTHGDLTNQELKILSKKEFTGTKRKLTRLRNLKFLYCM